MPDLNFIAAFAAHPATLSILLIAAILIVVIWRVSPYIKDLLVYFATATDGVQTKLDTLVQSDIVQTDQLRLNTLDVLRLTVYNEAIAIEDRLVAAKRYFVRGGNGKVAAYAKELIKIHPTEWSTILAIVSPEERKQLETIVETGDH